MEARRTRLASTERLQSNMRILTGQIQRSDGNRSSRSSSILYHCSGQYVASEDRMCAIEGFSFSIKRPCIVHYAIEFHRHLLSLERAIQDVRLPTLEIMPI